MTMLLAMNPHFSLLIQMKQNKYPELTLVLNHWREQTQYSINLFFYSNSLREANIISVLWCYASIQEIPSQRVH
jgi:hypothetical protein